MPRISLILAALVLCHPASAQTFVLGSDLSYANQMEDCGADFRQNGVSKDVYQILADHGTNLVRARLWVDPTWQNALTQPAGVKSQYSDLADVTETFTRARAAGMHLLLGFHYSDFWTDPGKQIIPARWQGVADNLAALKDSVYAYTYRTLLALDAQGLMPDIVKVGNENNGGILMHRSMTSDYRPSGVVSTSWARHAQLFNAGIQAVRDAGAVAAVNPRIAIHFAGLNGLSGRFQNLISNGVTDFDIMGFSYYYAWHEASIGQLGSTIRGLRSQFPGYEAMVVETGYLWTTANADGLGNIISTPDPDYLPISLVKQREYMVDYSREVARAGGSGVVFWESAWVSTTCVTPWGQGSSQDHVAFFRSSDYNFLDRGAGTWPDLDYYQDLDAVRVRVTVDMTGQSVSDGVYVEGSLASERVQMDPIGGNRYFTFLYVTAGSTGTYRFVRGATTAETVPAACATGGMRTIQVPSEGAEIAAIWGQCLPGSTGPMDVTFAVDMTGQDTSRGVFITGIVTNWQIVRMTRESGELFVYRTQLDRGSTGAYYYLRTGTWDNYLDYRESVPAACASWYGSDRGYAISDASTVFAVRWGSCETVAFPTGRERSAQPGQFVLHPPYPNPARDAVSIEYELVVASTVRFFVYDLLGRNVTALMDGWQDAGSHRARLTAKNWPAGIYRAVLETDSGSSTRSFVLVR